MTASGKDIQHPTHDITLTDGTNTVGLMLADRNGRNNPLAIRRQPYPRQSTKISQTNNKYSDLEPPYYSSPQDDFSGGRGSLNFEDDTTRYIDSLRCWSDKEKLVCCGPQETYISDYGSYLYRQIYQQLPGDVTFISLINTNRYYARKFTTGDYASVFPIDKVGVVIQKIGTPTASLAIRIHEDNAGSPGTVKGTSYLTVASITDNISEYREISLSVGGIIKNTTYWISVAQLTGTPTIDNHWSIGVDATTTPVTYTKKSSNGSTWATAGFELYYRIIDNKTYKWKYFEYKRQLYAVNTRYAAGVSYLFINGDRGVASDNSTDKSYLYDSGAGGKSWTTNEWAGCTVLITRGAGSADRKPWRTIISNTADSLCVYDGTNGEDWDRTHDTTTEYVILGSNQWNYLDTISGAIYDLAVADEWVYFACGGGVVKAYNAYARSGYWDANVISESVTADNLCAINTPTGWELWGSQNTHGIYGACAWRAKVPKLYSSSAKLYNLISVLDDGKGVWDEQVVDGVTVTREDDGMKIACTSTYSTGVMCSKEIPVTDFTKATKIGFMAKCSNASVGSNLFFKYDDTQQLGKNYTPDHVWHYDAEIYPTKVLLQRAIIRPSSVYHYHWDEGNDEDAAHLEYEAEGVKWMPLFNTMDNETANGCKFTYDKGTTYYDYLYISSSQRMVGFYMGLGSTKNSAASRTMTVQYWNGEAWADIPAIDLTDGTYTTTSMAQPGYVKFTSPTSWSMGCGYYQSGYLASDRYHLRVKWNDDLTANIDITQIYAYSGGLETCLTTGNGGPVDTEIIELKNAIDGIQPAFYFGSYVTLHDNDSLYLVSNKRFDVAKFRIAGSNNQASTIQAYYWRRAEGWVTMSLDSDSTSSGGAAFAQDGEINFAQTYSVEAGRPEYLAEYISDTDYVIRIQVNIPNLNGTYYSSDQIGFEDITLKYPYYEDLPQFKELTHLKDGRGYTSEPLFLTTDDFIYIMHSSKFNKLGWDINVANTITASMVLQYFNGYQWVAHTMLDYTSSASKTLAIDGEMTWTIPDDWMPVSIGEDTGYAIRLYPSADLYNEPVLLDKHQIHIAEVYVMNDDAVEISIPALSVADTWYYVEADINPNANPNPDESKIISIGIGSNYDANASYNLYIAQIDLITEAIDYFKLGNRRVNAIEAYGSERQNPWYFTEDQIYEVQTQNDNAIVAMPLREIRTLSDHTNGQAHSVSDVYLIFNLGDYIQKYYEHTLDDISPSKDEGLPTNRQGDPTCLISYPGRIFLSIDAGSSGYSSILLRRSAGWHELYRAPYGNSVHDMIIQVVPGLSTRLWVSQGNEMLWLPLPTNTWNPKDDSNFRYTHESVLTTGWITLGFLDVDKFWKSLKLYTENLTPRNPDGSIGQYIEVEYQLEDGSLSDSDDWISVGTFEESPFDELLLSDDYDVTGRRIRFRYKLKTTSNEESPILKSTLLESLMRFPVKYSYSCTVRLEDYPEDYKGSKDTKTKVEDITDQIEEWADAPTVLTWRCNYSPYDNKRVVIEPPGMQPIFPWDPSDRKGYEKHLATITLLEV